ncbi:MAG: LptE family protein [Nitrospirae bacterium]|nr:LptE family protein [Nitrospirota bacterium]
MNKRSDKILIVFWAILFLIISSCGYRFAGRANELPPHLKSVAVPMFANATYEPLLETVITNKVIQEFIADGRLRVVDTGKADAVLKGRISAFELAPLSFDRSNNVMEYRVVIHCEVVFEDVKNNKIIWKEPALSQSADYKVSGDISATRAAKERAIDEASKRLASDLVARLFEGF